jgi:hypothetical protein
MVAKPILIEWAGTLLALVLAVCPARAARLWIEAGPSFDRAGNWRNSATGYALGGGVHIGRGFALTLGAGFEHYPGTKPPELVPNSVFDTPSPTLSLEGGGNKKVVTGAIGIRVFLNRGPGGVFAEAALGDAVIDGENPRTVDPTTGATLVASGPMNDSMLLREFGAGYLTHRSSRYDWMLGVRIRRYSGLFQDYRHGGSVQVRLGLVTP